MRTGWMHPGMLGYLDAGMLLCFYAFMLLSLKDDAAVRCNPRYGCIASRGCRVPPSPSGCRMQPALLILIYLLILRFLIYLFIFFVQQESIRASTRITKKNKKKRNIPRRGIEPLSQQLQYCALPLSYPGTLT